MKKKSLFLVTVSCLWMFFSAILPAAETNSTLVDLNNLAFFHGREYFALRSGRAQMVVQADRADLGAAFKYLIFDAREAQSSARKTGALNYEPQLGFENSALVVGMGGFPFTALGHRTGTRWAEQQGIPAVEASWWAGAVRLPDSFRGGTIEIHSAP